MRKKKITSSKTRELFELMDTEPNWEKYVTKKTADVIKKVYETQDMKQAETELNMKGVTIRSHILRAAERIRNKDTEFKHGGKNKNAVELFSLMDTIENWENYVTPYEAELARKFRDVQNFYELGRQLNLAPGNIHATLYGSADCGSRPGKLGVVGKIKSKIPQVNRRDFSVLDGDQNIEDLRS